MDEDKVPWREELIGLHIKLSSRVREVLYQGHTRFQSVEIVDSFAFGRTLILDGKTQSTEADEFIYHESLVHPALVTHTLPQKVFIAGGGEGATLREVLVHKSITKVVMADIDQEVVEICQRYLPQHHRGAFQDPRVSLRIADARGILRNDPTAYDVIILDLPDPIEDGPATQLYTQEFYREVLQRLSPQGILVLQAGPCTLGNLNIFTALNSTLLTLFPRIFPYYVNVPSFGSDWGFILASRGPNPLNLTPSEVDQRLDSRLVRPLDHYDGTTHQGMFSLPKFVRQALAAEKRVITDSTPLVIV